MGLFYKSVEKKLQSRSPTMIIAVHCFNRGEKICGMFSRPDYAAVLEGL